MTRQQTFKRRVRARMSKTGERYTAARRQVLGRQPSSPSATVDSSMANDGATSALTSPPDPAARRRAALLNTRRRSIEQSTGTALDDWIALLDRAGARSMSHRQIWKWLADMGQVADGMLREQITIAYEQHIGRRELGQSCTGDFPAAANRALSTTLDEALEAWLRYVDGRTGFNGLALQGRPNVSRSEKFRYWRAKLEDDTQLNVTIYRQGDGRVSLTLQHRPHPDRGRADAWRAYWRAFLRGVTCSA